MGLSVRAYARHRGVTDTAVHKAIRVGRITPEPDGTLNPETADRDWDRNSQVKPDAGTAHRAVTVAGESGGGGTSLLQAKTVNEVVKAQTNKVRLAKLKGDLIDRNQTLAQVFKLARIERDAWLNWPGRVSARMAADLGLDAHRFHVALEQAVREHLQELGDIRVGIGDG
ncbi:Elements of external origin [Gammaproteobacteria bacterium]